MKGFMKDDKFHPIKPYQKKRTRKSRDQSSKQQGVKIERKQRVTLDEDFYEGFWIGLNLEKRRKLIGLYDPRWKSHATRDYKDLNPQEKGWVREQADKAFFQRKQRDNDEDVQICMDCRTILDPREYPEAPLLCDECKWFRGDDNGARFKRTEGEMRMARETDPEFAQIKDKKFFIEPMVLKILQKSDDGRDIILARNYARDFSSPYLYFGVTKSGNVKLGEITKYAFKGEKEEIRNLIGKPEFDRANNAIKLAIDGHTFHADLSRNLTGDLNANMLKGNAR